MVMYKTYAMKVTSNVVLGILASIFIILLLCCDDVYRVTSKNNVAQALCKENNCWYDYQQDSIKKTIFHRTVNCWAFSDDGRISSKWLVDSLLIDMDDFPVYPSDWKYCASNNTIILGNDDYIMKVVEIDCDTIFIEEFDNLSILVNWGENLVNVKDEIVISPEKLNSIIH